MAKVELRHLCLSNDGSFITAKMFQDTDKTVTANVDVRVFDESRGREILIQLDKSTAIRFAKTLRTEINKIQ